MNFGVIPYAPRYPQTEIHPKLESHRFCVLVTHRRMGKTVMAVNHTIKMALQNRRTDPAPRYYYVAPFRGQARDVAWDYVLKYTANFPGREVHEQRLEVTFHGRKIQLLGADNPDSLRGRYADGVVLDEYAQIKRAVFGEIVRPMITDHHGWVLFCGTPKGQDNFYNQYVFAKRESLKPGSDWWAGVYPATQTGVISAEELDVLRRETVAAVFRQEYLCDFLASSTNALVPMDLVEDAKKRYYPEARLLGAPKIIGVDPARFGDDRSVIFKRQGLQAYAPVVMSKLDNVDLAGRVAREVRDFKPDAVFVDAGNGAGVIDVLRRMGVDVIEVPFGGKPLNPGQYANKRAEMWGEMAAWIKSGGALPEREADLGEELACAVYDFDAAGRMRLEPKDKIKERLGKSPDLADALALTFAAPVLAKRGPGVSAEAEFYNTDYDFLG